MSVLDLGPIEHSELVGFMGLYRKTLQEPDPPKLCSRTLAPKIFRRTRELLMNEYDSNHNGLKLMIAGRFRIYGSLSIYDLRSTN